VKKEVRRGRELHYLSSTRVPHIHLYLHLLHPPQKREGGYISRLSFPYHRNRRRGRVHRNQLGREGSGPRDLEAPLHPRSPYISIEANHLYSGIEKKNSEEEVEVVVTVVAAEVEESSSSTS